MPKHLTVEDDIDVKTLVGFDNGAGIATSDTYNIHKSEFTYLIDSTNKVIAYSNLGTSIPDNWPPSTGNTTLKGLSIGNKIETIGINAFSGCAGLTGTLTIPDSVTTIGSTAFAACTGFNSLTIGNLVTTIGLGAFFGCNKLNGSIIIPDSVTSIEQWAFKDCTELDAIYINADSNILVLNAFQTSNLYGTTLYVTSTHIDSYGIIGGSFQGCTIAEWTNYPNLQE